MRFLMRSKNWLWLMLAVMSVLIFMAQRPSGKQPSPADPGMNLSSQPSKRGSSNQSGPRGPIRDVKPEKPEVNPTDPDPGAGDGPDLEEDDTDAKDDDSDVQQLRILEPLAVNSYEFARIGDGSAFGKPGEWLVVVYGQGFLAGEEPPILHLGLAITLREVFVNEVGTELYAIVPPTEVPRLQAAEFQQIAVQNPGGMNRAPINWGRLNVIKTELEAKIAVAKATSFRHGAYFLERIK